MKLIVWEETDWFPGKHNDFPVKRVVFKDPETKPSKTYYLNLDKKQMDVVNRWLPSIVKGNMLDVELTPIGPFSPKGNIINKFAPFKVVNKVGERNKDQSETGI